MVPEVLVVMAAAGAGGGVGMAGFPVELLHGCFIYGLRVVDADVTNAGARRNFS